MAVAVLSMLSIGMTMASTVSSLYSLLASTYKPLGVMTLLLVIVRLWVQFTAPIPPLSAIIPAWQRGIARLSHWVFYLMILAQPLIDRAMLSTAGYLITLGYGIVLPPILGVNNDWYMEPRPLYTQVTLALFVTVTPHLAAMLLHAFVLRGGVFSSMTDIRKPQAHTTTVPGSASNTSAMFSITRRRSICRRSE